MKAQTDSSHRILIWILTPGETFTASRLDITGDTLWWQKGLLLLSHGKQTSLLLAGESGGGPSAGWMSGILQCLASC